MEAKKTGDELDDILQQTEAAKYKLLQGYLKRINDGDNLKPQELRQLKKLEVDFNRSKKFGDEEEYFGWDAACEFLGCSKRTLHNKIKKGEVKQEADGSFRKSHLQEVLEETGAGDKSLSAALREAELRYRQWKAEREEITVKQLKGELVTLTEVERQFTLRAYELTRGLLFLSRRVGHLIAGKSKKKLKDVVDIIDAEVYALMDRYSRAMAIGEDTHRANDAD